MATSAKKVTNDWNVAKDKYDSNMREMIFATEQLDDAIGALEVSKGLGDTEGIIKLRNEIDLLESRIAPLGNNVDRFGIAMELAGNKANDLTKNITGSTVQTAKLDKGMKKVEKSTRKASKSTNGISGGIAKGIKSLGKYALALFGVRAIYSTLRKLSQQWLDSDQAGAKQIKSNLLAISSALSNALAPIITYIANLFVTIVAYANALLKAFFGIDLLSKGTAKNTNKINSGAKKVTKELKKWTGSFDKADIASSNISDNMDSAGGGGGMDLPPAIIPTPDVSGLLKSFDTIKTAFLDIWNSEDMQSVLGSLTTIFRNAFDMFVSISVNTWDNVERVFNAMLPNINQGFINFKDTWLLILSDMADSTDVWFPIITESVNDLVDNIYTTFEPLLVFMSQLWADITGIMLEIWEEYGDPILDNFMKFIDDMIDIFNLIWTEIIDPIIKPAIDFVKKLWDEHLKDLVKEFGGFIGDLILGAQELWNEVFKPIIDWIITKIGPVFVWLAETIFPILGRTFGEVADTIKNIIKDLRKVFGGFIDFIVGSFTGDWGRAWQGVKDMFSGIISGLANIFRKPINFIIDGINKFLRGINGIKIPDWVPFVGGKGFSVPTIPRLAKGGVLREETLNIAGEYAGARTNPEIVTPQNTMRETFEDVLSRMGNLGKGGNETINLVVNGEKLASVLRNEYEKENFMMNGGMNFATI